MQSEEDFTKARDGDCGVLGPLHDILRSGWSSNRLVLGHIGPCEIFEQAYMTSDIPGLRVQGSVVTPSSPSYKQAISRPSATSILHPAYVIYPQLPSDIPEILRFAASHDPPLDVAVKGGGTNTMSGLSSCDAGIVIDLARLNHVKVSEDKKTVAVGGGALWGDVYSKIEDHHIVVVGANVWSVGVGGLLVGGGYSNLSGQHGLAIDNLVEATVVLADGRIVTCNGDQEPDLFWAIRGGSYLDRSKTVRASKAQEREISLELSPNSY
jgi:hypothetical protein